VVPTADRRVRALSDELGGDAGRIAERLGLDGEGLEEAAWGRSEAMFHTVTDPHQFPGPRSAGAVAGAWLHGALCGAAAHTQAGAPQPERLATAADMFEAVRSYGAQCTEMGDSKAALASYGMLRARDQPAFAELAPPGAVAGVSIETGMTDAVARDVLGLMALDGMAVARNALDRLARDPTPPGSEITSALATSRPHRNALELMTMPPPILDDDTPREASTSHRRAAGRRRPSGR
jgi:hypothetical protein